MFCWSLLLNYMIYPLKFQIHVVATYQKLVIKMWAHWPDINQKYDFLSKISTALLDRWCGSIIMINKVSHVCGFVVVVVVVVFFLRHTVYLWFSSNIGTCKKNSVWKGSTVTTVTDLVYLVPCNYEDLQEKCGKIGNSPKWLIPIISVMWDSTSNFYTNIAWSWGIWWNLRWSWAHGLLFSQDVVKGE